MSGSMYDADQAALDTRNQPWSEAFRTQRDVGLRVPINYLTTSAASLRAACFSHNQYENTAFQKCFSNLLAVGFRRFLVDVYWDQGRSVWSLCPVEVPLGAIAQVEKALSSTAPAPTATLAHSRPNPRQVNSVSESRLSPASSDTVSPDASSTISESPVASSSIPNETATSITSFLTKNNEQMFQLGSYNCTSRMTLDFLTGIFESFLDATSTTTEAAVTYLILNIHAATSYADPDAPAQQPPTDKLPKAGNFISDIVRGNLSDEMYTPNKLRDQRADLNRYWLDVAWNNRPAEGYYETLKGAGNRLTTPNGWPTEAYMEFLELYRLVASFGSIDPQMSEYDVNADMDNIFSPGTIRDYRNTTLSSSGEVTSGCLFAPTEDTITSTTNSSWALTAVPPLDVGPNPDLNITVPSIGNLTACGLLPFLNSSISNLTADQNSMPYAAFVHSTLWTWAPGQPLNATSTADGSTQNRCAAIYMSPNPGRWRVLNCKEQHRVACQNVSNPYQWDLSSSLSTYFNGGDACPDGYDFTVPHTALENAHLLSTIENHPAMEDDPTAPVFLNLNSLNVPDCWALQINGTCPYLPPTDTNRTRVVVVPTVAAVIIFVLAALTFFVKCAANRREDKRGRRRRMVGGWEYEGVPS